MRTQLRPLRAIKKRIARTKTKSIKPSRNKTQAIFAPSPQALAIWERDNRLYDKFARALEVQHKGDFVAISFDGDIILRPRLNDAMIAAVERFGHGHYALRRIGFSEEMVIR